MKKAINAWSFPSNMILKEKLLLAKEAGFEGFEPALGDVGEVSLESTDEEILEFKKTAEKIGLELTSLATGLYWAYPPTSNDAKKREIADVVIKRQIDVAKLLSVKVILVVPGLVFAPFASDEVVEYKDAFDRAVDFIKSNADYAKENDILIGIENVWNGFLCSPIEMNLFIDTIDHPNVGVYLDVGNILNFGYPEHWISILKEKIIKVHIKDFRRKIGNINGFVDLLSGDLNFPEVMKRLKAVGYNDYIIAEMGGYNHHKTQIVFNTSAAMTRILEDYND